MHIYGKYRWYSKDIIAIKMGSQQIILRLGEDGLYRDENHTIYALRRESKSLDDIDRCGIYPFVVPFDNPLEPGCVVHDYMYESPVFQLFYSRSEADAWMKMLQKQATRKSPWRVLVKPFHWIARQFGSKGWEVKETND